MTKDSFPLQIEVPGVTKNHLRLLAAKRGQPMRLIVLQALSDAGIKVPKEELKDRRKNP